MSAPGPHNPGSPGAAHLGDDDFEPVPFEDADSGAELVEAGDPVGSAQHPPAPPPRRQAPAAPTLEEITDQDREFIQRVFLQVRDVDFRAPPPPPPRRDVAGPDKKIAALRQTVHELERDLARVGWVWSAMQQQYEAADQLLAAKEAEREAAVARYVQIRELAAQSAARDHAEVESARRRVAEVEAHAAAVEAEATRTAALATQRVQRAEQEKAALVADVRAKMEAAQQAFNQLREQSARAINERDSRIGQLEEELASKTQEADLAAGALSERTAEMAAANDTLAAYRQSLEQLEADKERLESELDERNRGLSTLTDELSRLRGHYEVALEELRASLGTKDELVEATRNEVRSARAEFDQLAGQHEVKKAELEQVTAELTAARTDLDRLAAELGERDQRLTALELELDAAREEARFARADAQAIGQQLAQMQK